MNIAQITIICSLLSFIVIGLLVKKSSMTSYSGFTMNKGKLGWFPIAAGISMTFAGGATILTTASVGYTYKWYSLIDPSALMIGIFIVMLLYKKYENDNGTTISELLSTNHKGLTILIGAVTSFTFLLIVAANFVALSKLLSPYFPSVDPLLITFVFSTLVFSYVFFGGFNSVTRTDILQYILITLLLIIPILLFVVSNRGNLVAEEVSHEFSVMPVDYIILFSIPILFTPLSQDINLRIKSAMNIKKGKIGLFMGGIFYFSIALSAAFVGVYMGNNNIELADPEQAIPLFFIKQFPRIGFIAIIAALAAIVSTLDSYTLNSIVSISNDIIRPLSRKNNVATSLKVAAVMTYVISMSIALFFNKVLLLSLTSLLLYISILTPIALGKVLHMQGSNMFAASIINILAILCSEITTFPISPKAIIYPLFGCFVILLVYLTNKFKPA